MKYSVSVGKWILPGNEVLRLLTQNIFLSFIAPSINPAYSNRYSLILGSNEGTKIPENETKMHKQMTVFSIFLAYQGRIS